VVVLGGGFGGIGAAKNLRKSDVDVVLVDGHDYHTFQPLLYQVATGLLEQPAVGHPIRDLFDKQHNVRVHQDHVTGIDLGAREVSFSELGPERYDYLVLALGAEVNYFGVDGAAEHAFPLYTLADAVRLKDHVLERWEAADRKPELIEDGALNVVVVGGGPTGVELAGAIAELANKALAADFRRIDPRHARVILVEAGPRLLPVMPERLSAKAARALERLGVEIRVGQALTACDAEGAVLANERVVARTILWAAGVAASPAAKWLNAEKDRAGRDKVGPDLTLPCHPEVFVIGDTAAASDGAGKALPGIAPAAKQAGQYVAAVIRARVKARPAPAPFRYRHLGNLATIGRKAAVVDFGWPRLAGRLAWLLWGAVHIFFLIGFRNRLVVLLDWLWAYLTFERGARLITGGAS
jgi:NADH:ubiquinone reductase (H+-translocating)